jgi:hypothetical protein
MTKHEPFRELNPYVGVDPTDEEIRADLEDDIEYLKRLGDHDKARELEEALRDQFGD